MRKGVRDAPRSDIAGRGGKVGSRPCCARNFFRNVTVQRAVLRRRGRQSAIGGPRPRFRLETLAGERIPPRLSVLRCDPVAYGQIP